MRSEYLKRVVLPLAALMLLIALGLLTYFTIDADLRSRQTQESSRQEQLTRLALWRMDSFLAPVLAYEATREWQFYCSQVKSPEWQNARYVLGHFHWPHGPDNQPESYETVVDAITPEGIDVPQGTEVLSDNLAWEHLASRLAFANRAQGRLDRDLELRGSYYISNATQQLQQQRNQQAAPLIVDNAMERERYAVCRPLWVGNQLILARRFRDHDIEVLQGCLLDWESIRRDLLQQIRGELPHADLQPARKGSMEKNLLACLPVALSTPAVPPPSAVSPQLKSFLVGCWMISLLAVGFLVFSAWAARRFGEKRASFVSAVTHELRTPLTTFKMYSEMLARGIVAPDKQQSYLQTLAREANRLGHLIENVLTFSRLENRGSQNERRRILGSDLLNGFLSRVTDHTTFAGCQLQTKIDLACQECHTLVDPLAIEQIVFNLVDNACKYGVSDSSRRIELHAKVQSEGLVVVVRDFGPGLTANAKRKLFEPFSKSAQDAAGSKPGVGLGLALCQRLSVEQGTRLLIEDHPQGGCVARLWMRRDVSEPSGR